MLKLFLLRHAQAAGSYDVNDYQRPLTLNGINQSKLVAPSLPDIKIALCSSALRTKMTLDTIDKAGVTIQKTIHADGLYNSSAGDLLSAIQGCTNEETILVVAHNPGIHQLANILSTESGGEKREALRYSYAPATLSILECPIDNWADIKPEENRLVDLVVPE